ncbi:hypothetical protein ACFVJ4_36345 [Streptomyces sp. NPDC127178]|uniref:hypothetical protein n=1 Tax=unclassified Streptomyces TaxID=2593676 RepID=UPI003633C4AD
MAQPYRVQRIGRLYAVICLRTRRIVYATTDLRLAGRRAQKLGQAQAGALKDAVPAPRRPAD